jgi:hypothetical protein
VVLGLLTVHLSPLVLAGLLLLGGTLGVAGMLGYRWRLRRRPA